jgi:hypothetical protein
MDPALVREKYEWSNNWFDCADDTTLPRVMLIGDSISVGYGPTVIEELAGLAHVDRLSNSRNILDPVLHKEIRAALEDRTYGGIHFNNGLHGWHLSIQQYAQGLEQYIGLLREFARGARLIWASSTPCTMVDDPATANPDKNPVVVKRNAAAAEIMAQFGIPTNDLYALVVDRPELKSNDGAHFLDEGKQVQGKAAARVLRAALRQ